MVTEDLGIGETIDNYLQVQGYIQVASKPASSFAREILAECELRLSDGRLKEVSSIGQIRTFQEV